jgi:iron complex transport system substrate-binding protein
LPLPFEKILEKAQNAEYWIAPGDFSSLKQMSDSNPHYSEFAYFKNKKVYSYGINKGAKGGILYFEWSPTRPDWVLKDLITIFHPELLPNHKLFFFQKLE